MTTDPHIYDAKMTKNLTPGVQARRYYAQDTAEWRTVATVEDIGTATIGWNRRRVTFTNGSDLDVTERTRWEVRWPMTPEERARYLEFDEAHEGCRIDGETGDCIDRECHR